MTVFQAGAAAACRRLATDVGGLRGWRRAAVAVAAGILAAAALPPLHALPALLLSLPVLVWLIDGAQTFRRAFADGWWYGFGHFVAGLYWIGFSLLVDAAQFAWLLPFATLCIPAALAVYVGLAAVLARFAAAGWTRLLALAAAWTVAEWARGQLLTGFPWNALGIVWTLSDATMQFAAVGGMFALSMIAVLVAASPAMLGHIGGRRAWLWPAGALIAVPLLWAGGELRLAGAVPGVVPEVTLRIVQPNIPQQDKWRPALRDTHLETYLRLSAVRRRRR
jgi:apolipoprotein N-acyltransferase